MSRKFALPRKHLKQKRMENKPNEAKKSKQKEIVAHLF
jgi:hypothetical protein